MRNTSLFVTSITCVTCTLAGCADDEVRSLETDVVVAEFDPAAVPPVAPTPTDLIRDPETGRIMLPVAPDSPEALRDFAAYLARLDAYPPMSSASATFSAPIDASSVDADAIVAVDLTIGQRIEGFTVAVDASGTRITVVPPGGVWPAGRTIGLAVIGYGRGVTGAAGEPVIASPATFFARSTRPISDCVTPATGCTSMTPLLSPEQAAALEGLRRSLAPLFDAIEAAGVDRDEIALAWSFTVSSRPFAVYDPAAGEIPFPNDLLRDPATGRVELPVPPGAPPGLSGLAEQLGALDGFSTTAPAIARVALAGHTLQPDSAAAALRTSIPRAVPGIDVDRLIVQPGRPLDEQTTYLVAFTRELVTTEGVPVEPPPLVALLASSGPLVEDDRATVPILTDDQARLLEPLRQGVNAALAGLGLAGEDVVLIWSFTTQSTISLVQQVIAELPALGSTGAEIAIPPGVPAEHIGSLRAGSFTGAGGVDVPYLLALPEGEAIGSVLFVHGLGTDKSAMLAIADPLAAQGFAVAAMDLPLSGDRAVPGRELLDPTDLLGTRDRLIAATAELQQLRRAISVDGLGGIVVAGDPALVGVSLGGIVTADLAGAQSLDGPIVLSTTGAGLAQAVATSPTLGPVLADALEQAGVEPGSPEMDFALVLVQTLLDAADPANYAARIPGPRTLVQIAAEDQVIPPASGVLLGQLAGARTRSYEDAGHSALVNPSDPGFPMMLGDMIEAVAGGVGQ